MRMRSVPSRTVSTFVSFVLMAPSITLADSIVRCESSGYRYQHCRADTGGGVTVDRQLSHTSCRQGDNWGYDRRGIWVNKGCGAEFRVRSGGSSNSNALKAGAAIAGIAIVAALAARNSNSGNQNADVASWAVGTFRAYDSYERANVEMTILPGGSVSGTAANHDFSGHLRGDQLEAGRTTFRISQQGNGFVATDVRDSEHRVHFLRSGGGY